MNDLSDQVSCKTKKKLSSQQGWHRCKRLKQHDVAKEIEKIIYFIV